MKPKINQLINKSVIQLKRGSPTILTCLGVAGLVATTVSAVVATPKAIEKIRKDSLINHDGDPCGYSKTEAIKSAWVYYIPSTVIGVSTIIWILIHDDMENGELETILEMPYDYIVEMICDWWAFSWANGNLYEIFNWYAEHSKFMKLAPRTRETVDDIIDRIKNRLDSLEIEHSGVKGMKWGVRNGPPYPIKDNGRVTAQKSTLKNAAGKDIIIVEHTKLTGEPNSITQVTHKRGGIDRNYYDDAGRQFKQISNNDHGKPAKHPRGKHGEHVHDYIYDNTGKLIKRPDRDLTDEERKENSDFL